MTNLLPVALSARRRWAGIGHSLVLVLALAFGPATPAAPATITIDGQRDAGYELLAVDPSADLAAPFAGDSGYAWADLTALYAVTDTTNLYVYVSLPAYSNETSTGQYALVIDWTGDVPNSGGTSDPLLHKFSFDYTATQVNSGTVPLTATNVILPDFLIRGNIPSASPTDNGYAELRTWNGSTWDGASNNWGELGGTQLVSARLAYALGQGVEFSIPFADLGLSPTVRLNLQFLVLPHYFLDANNTGAIDTVPSDDQATGWGDATVQHRLASQLPPPVCAGATTGDSAVVTAGLAHDSTQSTYHNPPGPLAAGTTAAFKLRACPGDLQGAQLLVWHTANPLNVAPVLTVTLTSTVQSGYAYWAGTAPAPISGQDQWYQFRLVDGGVAGYYRPASGGSGPGAWAATLAAPAWSWPTLPGAAVYFPLTIRP